MPKQPSAERRFVAFLRGINLGRRRPPMEQLKRLFEEMGFTQVATFIASGNIIFSSKRGEPARLEAEIAAHLEKKLGYPVDTFVRTGDEVVALARAQVFEVEPSDTATIHVALLQEPLSKDKAKAFEAITTPHDQVRVRGREYWWLCQDIRTSESEFWTLPQVRALKLPTATMRNLTSIRKLVAKHLT
jgi:uncharacterized protein (DUF1697 family)